MWKPRRRKSRGATKRRIPARASRIDPPLEGVDRTDGKLTVFELYEYGAFSDGGGRKD